MSWYRKYRPQKIEELNLIKVRETFLRMLKAGEIPQSLLFAGPKGTGKTSSARIIGSLLNDPANEERVKDVYLDGKNKKKKAGSLQEPDPDTVFSQKVTQGLSYVVQEMDAASNRGIDDIRSLRERVMLPPQEGSMSVYILDEVHMLTSEAFNALLKILEEPPAHVIFILATTELHKIPETIISRCTVVPFYKASEAEIIESLERITQNEKIQVETESLQRIARYADGSFRDAVKLLEQACQSGSFSQDVLDAFSDGSLRQAIQQLLQAVVQKDEKEVVLFFKEQREKNTDQAFFYKEMFGFLHQHLLRALGIEDGSSFSSQQVIRFLLTQLLEANLEVPSPIPFLPLELKLLDIILRAKKGHNTGGGGNTNASSSKKEETSVKKNEKKEKQIKTEQIDESLPQLEALEAEEELNPLESQVGSDGVSYSQLLFEKWEEFLQAVDSENSSLAALLHSSKPLKGENGLAKIGVYYRFHQEQLQLPRFKDIIEKCSYDLVGKKVRFDFLLQKTPDSANLVQLDEKTEKIVLARAGLDTEMQEPPKSSLSAMAADALM